MKKKYHVLGFVLVFVVFLSGCLGMSPETMAFANPLVKQFMSEYPNAQIQVTHFTVEQVSDMLENISSECSNPYMKAKDMYRITIDDPESGLKVVAWIDWENRKIECAVKYGTGDEKAISKPGEPVKTCKSHAEFRCYGQHVFWFDSCGHVQEKKEYCEQGCELGFCKEKERKTCEEMRGYCVYPEVVPAGSLTGMVTADQPLLATQDVFCGLSTYHECESNADCAVGGCSGHVCGGANEDMSTTCEYRDCYNAEKFGAICGCYDGKCKWLEAQEAKPVCVDSDDGKNYYQKGYVFTGGSKVWDYCNDEKTLTENYCTEEGQMAVVKVSCEDGKCEDGACFGGIGETTEKEEVITDLVCKEGYAMAEYWCPENGICCAPKEVKCESHYQYKCYEGHVYWFDSCGNREDKKEYCEYGCENGLCKQKQEQCQSRHEYKCYEGHVYWYDSCGNREDKKEYCEYGCEAGECKLIECASRHEHKCYSGDVYWYDSCGNKEERKEDCVYGCEGGECLEGTECVDFSCTIYEGDSKTVSYGGSTYVISLIGFSTTLNRGVIQINGNVKEVEKGKTYTLSGFEFSVKNLVHRNLSSVLIAMGEDPQLTIHLNQTTVTNGVSLSTDERGLLVGDNVNSVRAQLTAEDLPDLLKSEVFNDYYNNDYPYNQYIILGSSKIYDNYIDIGLMASQPVYTSKIVFTNPLDFSSPDVNSITEDMKLFGRNYIVLPGSTNEAVELFESYYPFSVNTGKNTTLTFEGDDFKFEMLGYTETEAILRINGNDVMWEEGKIYTLPGSTVRVYVSDVTIVYYGATESIHAVFMNLGRLVTIKNDEKVEVNYEDVPGTQAGIENTGGKVSSISVSVAGQDSDKIYSGEDFKDPVWESFELAFDHPTTLKSSITIQKV